MGKQKDLNRSTDLIAVHPMGEVTVLPPDSGVVGRFLAETENMFKARAMRMTGLLRKIDESGQRMEAMLRTALEKSEAAEAVLHDQFGKEGLLQEADGEEKQPIY